ncbi:hypothetical protein [Candidatus Absconditicoccus praedator]|uniref:hypothetical protein n=1 Tax=Candidatus Absconditicoccus praedator TaxID=2735562 RepID=UPI001E4B651C|nr:hypothetical protein [Candidatus Absconditicoccus praedator]UFX83093.1 hypothetical protein HLG78_03090 [Candidatus Absconditicoccus praedator]
MSNIELNVGRLEKDDSKEQQVDRSSVEKIRHADIENYLDTSDLNIDNIENKLEVKERGGKYYLWVDGNVIGYLESEAELQEFLDAVVDKVDGVERVDISNDIDHLIEDMSDTSIDVLNNFSNDKLIRFYNTTSSESKKLLAGEKIVDRIFSLGSQEELENYLDQLGSENVRKIIKQNIIHNEDFLRTYFEPENNPYAQIHGEGLSNEELNEAYCFFFYSLQTNNPDIVDSFDIIIDHSYSSKEAFAASVKESIETESEIRQTIEELGIDSSILEEHGLIGVFDHVLSQGNLSNSERQTYSQLGQLAAIGGAIYAGWKAIQNYGFLRTAGALVGGDFLLRYGTGNSSFDVANSILRGGWSNIFGGDGEVLDRTRESTESKAEKEKIGHSLLVATLFGDYEISEIRQYLYERMGNDKFDVERYMNTLGEETERYQTFQNLIEENGEDELSLIIAKGLNDMVDELGEDSLGSFEDEKTISTIFSSYINRVREEERSGVEEETIDVEGQSTEREEREQEDGESYEDREEGAETSPAVPIPEIEERDLEDDEEFQEEYYGLNFSMPPEFEVIEGQRYLVGKDREGEVKHIPFNEEYFQGLNMDMMNEVLEENPDIKARYEIIQKLLDEISLMSSSGELVEEVNHELYPLLIGFNPEHGSKDDIHDMLDDIMDRMLEKVADISSYMSYSRDNMHFVESRNTHSINTLDVSSLFDREAEVGENDDLIEEIVSNFSSSEYNEQELSIRILEDGIELSNGRQIDIQYLEELFEGNPSNNQIVDKLSDDIGLTESGKQNLLDQLNEVDQTWMDSRDKIREGIVEDIEEMVEKYNNESTSEEEKQQIAQIFGVEYPDPISGDMIDIEERMEEAEKNFKNYMKMSVVSGFIIRRYMHDNSSNSFWSKGQYEGDRRLVDIYGDIMGEGRFNMSQNQIDIASTIAKEAGIFLVTLPIGGLAIHGARWAVTGARAYRAAGGIQRGGQYIGRGDRLRRAWGARGASEFMPTGRLGRFGMGSLESVAGGSAFMASYDQIKNLIDENHEFAGVPEYMKSVVFFGVFRASQAIRNMQTLGGRSNPFYIGENTSRAAAGAKLAGGITIEAGAIGLTAAGIDAIAYDEDLELSKEEFLLSLALVSVFRGIDRTGRSEVVRVFRGPDGNLRVGNAQRGGQDQRAPQQGQRGNQESPQGARRPRESINTNENRVLLNNLERGRNYDLGDGRALRVTDEGRYVLTKPHHRSDGTTTTREFEYNSARELLSNARIDRGAFSNLGREVMNRNRERFLGNLEGRDISIAGSRYRITREGDNVYFRNSSNGERISAERFMQQHGDDLVNNYIRNLDTNVSGRMSDSLSGRKLSEVNPQLSNNLVSKFGQKARDWTVGRGINEIRQVMNTEGFRAKLTSGAKFALTGRANPAGKDWGWTGGIYGGLLFAPYFAESVDDNLWEGDYLQRITGDPEDLSFARTAVDTLALRHLNALGALLVVGASEPIRQIGDDEPSAEGEYTLE